MRFTKAHGSRNDFLLTRAADVPWGEPHEIAQAICDRHTGIGADGWLIVSEGHGGEHASIRLINSDGSDSEMSGNGTRCAAAFLLDAGMNRDSLVIRTGAGPKHLRLLERRGSEYWFEMNMGRVYYSEEEIRHPLCFPAATFDATIVNVGNPQCAVFVDNFDFDWREAGAAIEWHSRFPQRTNVSFVRPVDRHEIEVRFWERGAGETLSSGTGSTGAACAAILRGVAESPISVVTPAGKLELRAVGDDMMLVGPAEIVATGEFHWRKR